ncbi:hypothetical protein [Rugamonas sp. DEMB1]|uniref:hypothetical protein n=1 Tax=Rugamonas sp. DEMB1 TaxID=3039386 RepID=UPI002446A736|nr:hypothetical protein [Rugamonas sp. DEMB1]WGG51833.1 hypothetical protein QC826_06335 [Rugamonas sp. DEMB1]
MYDELDPDEPRRIRLLDVDGAVYNILLASINFCGSTLIHQPEHVYRSGGSWLLDPPPELPEDPPPVTPQEPPTQPA